MDKKQNILFKENIDKENAYTLENHYDGYKIPIVSDVMFYVMLNNEKRKKYAAYLISLALNTDYKKVLNSITFTKEKLDKENYYEKGKTVDLVCEVNNEIVNIEMNNYKDVTSLERNLSYLFDLYKSKNKMGKKYNFVKSIQININNFIFEGTKDSIETYGIIREDGKKWLTDKIIIINIYLPIIKEKCYNKEKLSEFEKLLLVFNETDNNMLNNLKEGNKIMEEYVKDATNASQDNEVIGLYDKELHDEMLKNTMIDNARTDGVELGIEIGIERGINIGIEHGNKQKQIEIAKNMLNKNMDITIISEITGLSTEEIEKL